MTEQDDRQHRLILQRIAYRVMLERGLFPDFLPQALAELRVQLLRTDVERGYIDFSPYPTRLAGN